MRGVGDLGIERVVEIPSGPGLRRPTYRESETIERPGVATGRELGIAVLLWTRGRARGRLTLGAHRCSNYS